MSHKVYLMRTERFIKIGITSSSIHKRISAVQTGCPLSIHTVQYWEVKCRNVALLIEKALHKKLENRNTHGEWFKNVSTGASNIREILNEYGVNFDNFKIIHLCKNSPSSNEADDILRSIKRSVEQKDLTRLIGVGKRIQNMPEKKVYDSICEYYQESILSLKEVENGRN